MPFRCLWQLATQCKLLRSARASRTDVIAIVTGLFVVQNVTAQLESVRRVPTSSYNFKCIAPCSNRALIADRRVQTSASTSRVRIRINELFNPRRKNNCLRRIQWK